jgi:hypothetical protein
MEHHDHNKKMSFSTVGARLGFMSYAMLVLLIVLIFTAG